MSIKEALVAFHHWMKFNHDIIIEFIDPPTLPASAALLHAKIDCMAQVVPTSLNQFVLSNKQLPILIKFFNQHPHGAIKLIVKIIVSRQDFCITKEEDGQFIVNKNHALWYHCHSIMALYKCSKMILLCFYSKSHEVLPIIVHFQRGRFIALFIELTKVLDIFDVTDLDIDMV